MLRPLYREEGGKGEDLLVLLHGLSGTGAIWRELRTLMQEHWPGRWIVPDFRGHGRSPHANHYAIALHAADIAGLVQDARNVVLVGHSMGGQCAMVLASGWFGFVPAVTITIGVAVDWGNEARERIDRLVHTPIRYFSTREEAMDRFMLVNGLKDYPDPDRAIAASGIAGERGRWRLAADNRAAMVADVETRAIYGAAKGPVLLLRGEHDPMVTRAEHLSLDAGAIDIPGCAHNAHVEAPQAVWQAIQQSIR